LNAGTGGDVLIGGRTKLDANLTALTALVAKWGSNDTYQSRVQDLFGRGASGQNGATLLNASTIFNESAVNLLSGSGDQNWYWLEAGTDQSTGEAAGEIVTIR
jgi:hypothetical protein